VDKANVLKSLAFFRRIFDERSELFPDVIARHLYVDAAALEMVLRPWDLDVVVTENMFGVIISDLAAGVVGGMGVAPSADIGPKTAMFQPSHGSAPDIAGQGIANPIAMIMSIEMMLNWLSEKYADARCAIAADKIRSAIDRMFVKGAALPADWGGSATTDQITRSIVQEISSDDARLDLPRFGAQPW
jgi:3-isopropylmalate dehydrogenase